MKINEARIFLCHASEDKGKVVDVYRKLKAAGYNPWLDKEDLLPGQFWDEEIPRAIKASGFMLIFLSTTSVTKRGYVQKEFVLALETLDEIPAGQIFLIPVRLDDCQIPDRFRRIHYVDLFEEGGFEKVIKAIQFGTERRGIKPSSPKQTTRPLPGQSQRIPGIQSPAPAVEIPLRAKAMEKLSGEEVAKMLKQYDFYCKEYDWSKKWANPAGKGIQHDFKKGDDGKTVLDKTTGLMWQQSGSPGYMDYKEAKNYIAQLKGEKFAGYSDWRLPTLEEAMSLMEPEQKHGNLFIDPVFDKAQSYIWTSDLYSASAAWLVNFDYGGCDGSVVGIDLSYVRAVRSRH